MAKEIIVPNNAGRRYHTAPNEQIKFILSNVETSGQFDFAENELGYLGGPPLHSHPGQNETHYILEGQLRYQIGEETYEAACGDCLHIPKGTPHAWINLHQKTARILAILSPGGSEGFFQTMSSSPSDQLTAEFLAKLAQDYGTEILGPPLAISLGFVDNEGV